MQFLGSWKSNAEYIDSCIKHLHINSDLRILYALKIFGLWFLAQSVPVREG